MSLNGPGCSSQPTATSATPSLSPADLASLQELLATNHLDREQAKLDREQAKLDREQAMLDRESSTSRIVTLETDVVTLKTDVVTLKSEAVSSAARMVTLETDAAVNKTQLEYYLPIHREWQQRLWRGGPAGS